MDAQNKNPNKLRLIRSAFVLCITLIAFVMVFITQNVVDQGMRNHQLQMVEMVASRITENMNHYFQGQWDNIQYVRNTLMQRSFTEEQEILNCLAEEEDALKTSYNQLLLLLIDDEGFTILPTAVKLLCGAEQTQPLPQPNWTEKNL